MRVQALLLACLACQLPAIALGSEAEIDDLANGFVLSALGGISFEMY